MAVTNQSWIDWIITDIVLFLFFSRLNVVGSAGTWTFMKEFTFSVRRSIEENQSCTKKMTRGIGVKHCGCSTPRPSATMPRNTSFKVHPPHLIQFRSSLNWINPRFRINHVITLLQLSFILFEVVQTNSDLKKIWLTWHSHILTVIPRFIHIWFNCCSDWTRYYLHKKTLEWNPSQSRNLNVYLKILFL